MSSFCDLSGKKFGRLTALKRVNSKKGNTYWQCQCVCQKYTQVSYPHLVTGHTHSCGCLSIEVHRKHGHSGHRSKSRTYTTWDSMIQRCTNSKNQNFVNYGKRGIKVCDRWFDFCNFLGDMGKRPKNLSLERVDNNGNYELANCRWVTRSEQNSNRRPYTWK